MGQDLVSGTVFLYAGSRPRGGHLDHPRHSVTYMDIKSQYNLARLDASVASSPLYGTKRLVYKQNDAMLGVIYLKGMAAPAA